MAFIWEYDCWLLVFLFSVEQVFLYSPDLFLLAVPLPQPSEHWVDRFALFPDLTLAQKIAKCFPSPSAM